MNAGLSFMKRYKELCDWDFKTIIDVGAHSGKWTSTMKTIFPNARFLMFEANEDCAIHLCKTSDENDVYEIVLLGDEDGREVRYYYSISPFSGGNSIYREFSKNFRDDAFITKKMVRLDTLLRKHNIDSIDYLKIDVQGSELNVLKGLGEYINKVKYIQLEIIFFDYNEGAPGYVEILKYMSEQGFRPTKFLDMMLIQNNDERFQNNLDLLQMDFVFERNLDQPISLRTLYTLKSMDFITI
jgi:FkbM family methyltransferase